MAQTNLPATTENEKRTPSTVAMGLKPQLAETLPKHIDPDAFARTVQTALQIQPDLLGCTPRSLMVSCMKAATDGLLIDGREAALIIRNVKVKIEGKESWETQATYQPMVQGLMKLARNSGEISSIVAHVVYQNDQFSYILGDDERIEHKPAALEEDQGSPIAVYAIVKLKDGTVVREIMRAKSVLAIAAQGKNAEQYDPNKGKNFAEWWRKTAIRRVSKYIPRSSDAAGSFTRAVERIDEDFTFDEPGTVQPPPTTKKRGGAAAALKDVTPAKPAPAKAAESRQEPPDEDEGRFPPPHDPETGEIIDADFQPKPGDDI